MVDPAGQSAKQVTTLKPPFGQLLGLKTSWYVCTHESHSWTTQLLSCFKTNNEKQPQNTKPTKQKNPNLLLNRQIFADQKGSLWRASRRNWLISIRQYSYHHSCFITFTKQVLYLWKFSLDAKGWARPSSLVNVFESCQSFVFLSTHL